MGPSPIGPRLRALYLLATAFGVFVLPWWQAILGIAALQVALWQALGLGAQRLLRQLRKLSLFCGLIFVAYALVSEDPATDRWIDVTVGPLVVEVNTHGALVGMTMVLRILAVVLASHVARAGDPRALAMGLRGLGMPRSAALALDATLVLFGDASEKQTRSGTGQGRGKGGGTGKGRGSSKKSARGFVRGIKRLARGDVSAIADRLHRHVRRVEEHVVQSDPDGGRQAAHDVAVVAGVALTMLGIKALKLLPGLPFAPGHKGVLLIPLYIVAGFMTRSRGGSTMTGLTMGTAAFLLGDGRWGLFEIAKHTAPGVLVDGLMPFLKMARRTSRALPWALLGLVIALGRFATITAIALCVQAPALVYAFLLPGLVVHGVFGVLSGLVTAPLVRSLDKDGTNRDTVGRDGPPEDPGGGGGPDDKGSKKPMEAA